MKSSEMKSSEMKSSEMKSSEMKSNEMKGSEMNVLSYFLSFKRMQICLQRFICSKKDAEITILKLFKQCKITVRKIIQNHMYTLELSTKFDV